MRKTFDYLDEYGKATKEATPRMNMFEKYRLC